MRRAVLPVCAAALLAFRAAEAVEFSTATAAGKRVTVCRVDLRKDDLQLFLQDESGKLLKTFDAVEAMLRGRGKKLVFAMNAGMYHPDYSPVGLFVSNGRQLKPVNLANGDGNFFLKPNGVFLLSAGKAKIVDAAAYPKLREPVTLATQSGPLLVLNGRLHPAFKADSESRLYRNGVGVPSPDVAIFVNTEEPVNFYEFATFFRDVLHCPNALFFDGTVSSLYSPELKRNDRRIDLGPIIGVVKPASPAQER